VFFLLVFSAVAGAYGHLSFLAAGAPTFLVVPMGGSRVGRQAQQKSLKKRSRPVEDTKRLILEQIQAGHTVVRACEIAGRSVQSYEQYRKHDPAFRAAVDRLRLDRVEAFQDRDTDVFPSFEEFSERFLGAKVFPHMLNVIDMVEGRLPRWTHPSMVFERGEPDLAICNLPPEHGKSTVLTMNYVTYRIAKDPNIRVLLISKTQGMARKFLFGIKTRLTHPRFSEFHVKYGPPGGYAAGAESWSQDMIYVSGDARDSGEKDPTVQALGIRGHVYGSRADIIILDDPIDLTNAHEYEKQIDWIQSEVVSRISASGMLLVVGTRLATKDLYLELRDPSRYPDEASPWSYLSMPAVLEFHDEPADWVTLWPKSNMPEIGAKGDMAEPDAEGLFPKWDGTRLVKKRARMQPRTWAMVYQQEQVNQDAVFAPEAVKAAINGNRMTGPIPRGMVGCRENGMDGLIVVAGLDPATSGHTAAVIIGLDTRTQKRYVLDVFNKPGITPEAMREMIRGYTDRYGISEWRIEKNGFQGFLVHDREINEYCASRGTMIRPHFTGNNKHDADFGVASMTTLFTGWQDKQHLIELPSTHGNEAAKSMVEQLVTWAPDTKKLKTDIVMALWFAELACRDRVLASSRFVRSHVSNPFLTPWDRASQSTVNLLDVEAARAWTPIGA
jgi:hypothetical protein